MSVNNKLIIDSKVKEFLLNHMELIDNFNFNELYLLAEKEDVFFPVEQITQCLWDIDIDPLKYLDRVPYCYCYTNKLIKDIVIPSHCNIIETYAFHGCSNLKRVIIEEGVTYINSQAFSCNNNLTDIYIPDSVVYIDRRAFEMTIKVKIHCSPNSYANEYFTKLPIYTIIHE